MKVNSTYPNFRFGGYGAILAGLLSILYAIFYLVISRSSAELGTLGSWLILALSGLFTSSAYVALYLRVRQDGEGAALWALLLGAAASFATLQHGIYEFLVRPLTQAGSVPVLPSQVDSAGLATFFAVGVVSLLYGLLILRGAEFPRAIGYIGILNALLLVVLFFATAVGVQSLVLISGGLTSVIVGPIWWIWLGISLLKR